MEVTLSIPVAQRQTTPPHTLSPEIKERLKQLETNGEMLKSLVKAYEQAGIILTLVGLDGLKRQMLESKNLSATLRASILQYNKDNGQNLESSALRRILSVLAATEWIHTDPPSAIVDPEVDLKKFTTLQFFYGEDPRNVLQTGKSSPASTLIKRMDGALENPHIGACMDFRGRYPTHSPVFTYEDQIARQNAASPESLSKL